MLCIFFYPVAKPTGKGHRLPARNRDDGLFAFLFLFRARGDAANAVPEGRHAADDVDDKRTGEIENEVVDVARAGACIDLRDLDRRDDEGQRRGEEKDAALPAEHRREKHAHRCERNNVAREVEHHEPQ